MKRVAICSSLVLAVTIVACGMVFAQVVNTTHTGGSPYSTIQAAISDGATVNGDTLTVAAGTYNESVTVNKALTLIGSGNPSVNDFTFTVNPVRATGFNVLTTTASGTGKIQDAIDAVSPTGNVGVESGTYHEHVVINKAMNLIGSSGGNPIIDGDGTGNCITVASSYIRIKQIVLTNAVNGISGTTTNSQIRYMTIHDNSGSGISLSSSDMNFIHSMTIFGHTSLNGCGIELIGCRSNTLAGNDIHGNTYNIRVSGAVYRSSFSNMLLGNTLVDPGTWSVQISSGAKSSKVNFNAFSTVTTENKFISNTSTAPETLDARSNWFQNQDPPGGIAHPTDFEGRIDSSNWFDNAANTRVAVMPQGYTLVTDDPVYIPVMAMVPPGKQVRVTQVTLRWNNTLAALEEGEIPGAFYRNKTLGGQTETFSFTPASPVNSVTVFDTLNGGTTGAGPSGAIPYVGTLFIMKYRGVSAGLDSLKLSAVVVEDQNFANISPLVTLSPATIEVSSTGTPGLLVDVKVALQGPLTGTGMDTTLRHNGSIPLSQPYNVAPFSYAGTENVASNPPDGAVDWIMVELRTGTAANTKFATRAGWLMTDGAIRELAGISPLGFTGLDAGNYYVVIRHRNHLAIMSATALAISPSSATYDFTTGQAQAFGTNPMIQVGSVFAMIAGDANGDGQVNATDRTLAFDARNLLGYRATDLSLDGQVNATDRTIAFDRRNSVTQVP